MTLYYSAEPFAAAPVAMFHEAFRGCTVTLVDGTQRPASRVTAAQVRGYLISAVWSPDYQQWRVADRVADGVQS